jgi:formylmethanofuran dehydrogenase subunit C
MEGGKITVRGNVGYVIGHCMRGGEIRYEGKYQRLPDTFKGGKIYHKGKLIVDK